MAIGPLTLGLPLLWCFSESLHSVGGPSFFLGNILSISFQSTLSAGSLPHHLELSGSLSLHSPCPFVLQEALSPLLSQWSPQEGQWTLGVKTFDSPFAAVLLNTEPSRCLVQAFSQDPPSTMACMLPALGGKVGRAVSRAWSTAERTEESGLKKVTAGQQAGSGRDSDPAVRSEG